MHLAITQLHRSGHFTLWTSSENNSTSRRSTVMLCNAQTKMLVAAVPPCPQCRRRAFSRLLTRMPCYVGVANPVAELSEATAGNSSVLRGLDRLKDQDNARLIKSPVQTRLKRIQARSMPVPRPREASTQPVSQATASPLGTYPDGPSLFFAVLQMHDWMT